MYYIYLGPFYYRLETCSGLVYNLLFFFSDKCNTEIDCKDKSDEHNCDFMFFGEQNYAKELIPRDEGGFHIL